MVHRVDRKSAAPSTCSHLTSVTTHGRNIKEDNLVWNGNNSIFLGSNSHSQLHVKLEIRSVERGICPILPRLQLMNELFL